MNLFQLFLISLKLGITSFGGPSAHLGFFQQMYVNKQRWIKNEDYAQLVALAQFLPGPASSQVGIAIGYYKAKILGSIVSFIGFTAPSALFLMGFALWLNNNPLSTNFSWIQGLKLVAVVIVFHAILTMKTSIIKSKLQWAIFISSTAVILFITVPFIHLYVLLLAILVGLFIRIENGTKENKTPFLLSKKNGIIFLSIFFFLLIILPLSTLVTNNSTIHLLDSFYRTGALVFGGGHVVLPLLQTEFVNTNLIDESIFLAGYGMTQAMPGPLFTFATFIGTSLHGVLGGIIATFAIFLPGYLLILGVYPFWQWCMNNARLQTSIQLMNAAVIGLLAAIWLDPIIVTTISSFKDVVFIAILAIAYLKLKVTPIILVISSLLIGIIFY